MYMNSWQWKVAGRQPGSFRWKSLRDRRTPAPWLPPKKVFRLYGESKESGFSWKTV